MPPCAGGGAINQHEQRERFERDTLSHAENELACNDRQGDGKIPTSENSRRKYAVFERCSTPQ
jgi:hypothetical protein